MPITGVPQYKGDNAGDGPSAGVWANCPVVDVETSGLGVGFYEDFRRMPYLVTPTITTEVNIGAGWKAFGSSGATLLPLNTLKRGIQSITGASDNHATNIATLQLPFKIIRGGGSLWFEARLKHASIADTQSGVFVGLIEQQTLSVIIPIVAAGTMADANFVGFIRRETNGDNVEAIYKANGVTEVAISATAGVPVADTYYKVGFYYNDADFSLRFYYNGVQVGSTYTLASAAGTDFPNDVRLGLCFATINAVAGAQTNTLDWIRAYQVGT